MQLYAPRHKLARETQPRSPQEQIHSSDYGVKSAMMCSRCISVILHDCMKAIPTTMWQSPPYELRKRLYRMNVGWKRPRLLFCLSTPCLYSVFPYTNRQNYISKKRQSQQEGQDRKRVRRQHPGFRAEMVQTHRHNRY